MPRLRLLSDKNYDRTNIIYFKVYPYQISNLWSTIPINNEYWVYPKQLIWHLVCTFIDMYDLTYFNRIGKIFFFFRRFGKQWFESFHAQYSQIYSVKQMRSHSPCFQIITKNFYKELVFFCFKTFEIFREISAKFII